MMPFTPSIASFQLNSLKSSQYALNRDLCCRSIMRTSQAGIRFASLDFCSLRSSQFQLFSVLSKFSRLWSPSDAKFSEMFQYLQHADSTSLSLEQPQLFSNLFLLHSYESAFETLKISFYWMCSLVLLSFLTFGYLHLAHSSGSFSNFSRKDRYLSS